MPRPTADKEISDEDFVEMFERLGANRMAKEAAISARGILGRRKRLEAKLGRQIVAPTASSGPGGTRHNVAHAHRLAAEIQDGIVLVGSDGHYWPGEASAAHRAFVRLCKDLQPRLVVMNGDAFDGASISRHPTIGWESKPNVLRELEACQERLHEIELAAGRRARLVWPLGNHDSRFETRLATQAPEFARVNGVHLKDHFSDRWEPCWALWINNNTVIKHRFKGGIHATHNNTMWAGMNIVTGHLHSLKVTPFSDYRGTRYGVDTGTLAHVYGPQFVNYTEDNPRNWRSGFAVLTFHKGELILPEVVHVRDDGMVEFRGEVTEP